MKSFLITLVLLLILLVFAASCSMKLVATEDWDWDDVYVRRHYNYYARPTYVHPYYDSYYFAPRSYLGPTYYVIPNARPIVVVPKQEKVEYGKRPSREGNSKPSPYMANPRRRDR